MLKRRTYNWPQLFTEYEQSDVIQTFLPFPLSARFLFSVCT